MSDELLAMFQEALGMFIFLGVELTTLFLLISFLVGVIQAWIPAEKIQSILSLKSRLIIVLKKFYLLTLMKIPLTWCICL